MQHQLPVTGIQPQPHNQELQPHSHLQDTIPVPVEIIVTTICPSKIHPALQLKSRRVTKNKPVEDVMLANKQATRKGHSPLEDCLHFNMKKPRQYVVKRILGKRFCC